MYFIITADDDGTSIRPLTKEQVIQYLENVPEDMVLKELPITLGDKDSIYKWSDPNYWPEGKFLIIKGEIVSPTPVKVVQGWDIE